MQAYIKHIITYAIYIAWQMTMAIEMFLQTKVSIISQ